MEPGPDSASPPVVGRACAPGCVMQRGEAVALLGVLVALGVEQTAHDGSAAASRRDVQRRHVAPLLQTPPLQQTDPRESVRFTAKHLQVCFVQTKREPFKRGEIAPMCIRPSFCFTNKQGIQDLRDRGPRFQTK